MRASAFVSRPVSVATLSEWVWTICCRTGEGFAAADSKSNHDHADFYLGLPNRLRPNDALVLLLDEKHVVLSSAELLLRYKEQYSRSNDGRLIPRIGISDGKLVLRLPRKGLIIPLDEYIDAYDSLMATRTHMDAGLLNLGRPFEPADENVTVSSASPFVVDADLVGRGVRAHARTLNALANHLKHLWDSASCATN